MNRNHRELIEIAKSMLYFNVLAKQIFSNLDGQYWIILSTQQEWLKNL